MGCELVMGLIELRNTNPANLRGKGMDLQYMGQLVESKIRIKETSSSST